MSWSPAMNDGFALAALIRGGEETLGAVLSGGCREAAMGRLADAHAGRTDTGALSEAFARTPSESQLRDRSARVRAALAPYAPLALKTPLAEQLRDLPTPRRGYRPPDGLTDALLAWRGASDQERAEERELSEWEQEQRSWRA